MQSLRLCSSDTSTVEIFLSAGRLHGPMLRPSSLHCVFQAPTAGHRVHETPQQSGQHRPRDRQSRHADTGGEGLLQAAGEGPGGCAGWELSTGLPAQHSSAEALSDPVRRERPSLFFVFLLEFCQCGISSELVASGPVSPASFVAAVVIFRLVCCILGR